MKKYIIPEIMISKFCNEIAVTGSLFENTKAAMDSWSQTVYEATGKTPERLTLEASNLLKFSE